MKDRLPERARDSLSQANFQEIYRDGHGVFLDLRHVTEEKWQSDPFSASMRHILGDRHGALNVLFAWPRRPTIPWVE